MTVTETETVLSALQDVVGTLDHLVESMKIQRQINQKLGERIKELEFKALMSENEKMALTAVAGLFPQEEEIS